MRSLVIATLPLLFGILLVMAGNGLQGTLLGIRASIEGFPTALTGVVMSGYYTGFLAGSILTPRFVGRVGHIRVFAALAALGASAVVLYPIFLNIPAWTGFRLLTGFAYSGMYVVTESWLNDRAENEQRGQILSVYMVTQFVGLTAGQFLVNLADPASFQLFSLGAVLLAFALVPVVLSRAPAPRFDQPVHLGILSLYRISPLGTLGLAGVGITNSAFWGMGAVYAKASGLTVADVALFMSVAIVAAAVCTWPLGRVSDRFDRRSVITVVSLGAGIAAVAAMTLADGERLAFFAAVFAYGGLALSLYSLCVAHANDRLQPEQMVAASSGLMLCYGVGAILGPMSVGALMDHIGPRGFFIYLALVHMFVGALAIYRMIRRPN